jgi:hypothetical protein
MLVGERRRKPHITQTRLARKEHYPWQLDAVIMTLGILDRMNPTHRLPAGLGAATVEAGRSSMSRSSTGFSDLSEGFKGLDAVTGAFDNCRT